MNWRLRLRNIIDESNTRPGHVFDVIVFISIALSVIAIILESIPSVRAVYGPILRQVEWVITIWFTIEYFVRLVSAPNALKYATRFYGIVDLLAIIPTYLSLFVVGTQSLMVLRAFRFLRIFRIFKLTRFVNEASTLKVALNASRQKIFVFMCVVLAIALVMGALMYVVEGDRGGFDSIPQGIYWAIVTMTTVGYGDVAPHTMFGKFLAAILMLLGYSIIAIPTGIVSVEIAEAHRLGTEARACSNCSRTGHHRESSFCRFCGEKLPHIS